MPEASKPPRAETSVGLSHLPCPGKTLIWQEKRVSIPPQLLLHPSSDPEWHHLPGNEEAWELLRIWGEYESKLLERVEAGLERRLCGPDGFLVPGGTGELRELAAASSQKAEDALEEVCSKVADAESKLKSADYEEAAAVVTVVHGVGIRESVKTFLTYKTNVVAANKLITETLHRHCALPSTIDQQPPESIRTAAVVAEDSGRRVVQFRLENSKGVHENILIAFALVEKNRAAPGDAGLWSQIQELKHAMSAVKPGNTYRQIKNVLGDDFGYGSGFASLRSALERFVRWFAAQEAGGEEEIYRILLNYKLLDPHLQGAVKALLRQ